MISSRRTLTQILRGLMRKFLKFIIRDSYHPKHSTKCYNILYDEYFSTSSHFLLFTFKAHKLAIYVCRQATAVLSISVDDGCSTPSSRFSSSGVSLFPRDDLLHVGNSGKYHVESSPTQLIWLHDNFKHGCIYKVASSPVYISILRI